MNELPGKKVYSGQAHRVFHARPPCIKPLGGNCLLVEESSLSGLKEGRKRWKLVMSFARKDASPTANQLLSGLPSIKEKKKTLLNLRRVQNKSLRKMKDRSGGRQRSQGNGKVERQEAKCTEKNAICNKCQSFFTACLILCVLSCMPPTRELIITDRQGFALIADTWGRERGRGAGGEIPK